MKENRIQETEYRIQNTGDRIQRAELRIQNSGVSRRAFILYSVFCILSPVSCLLCLLLVASPAFAADISDVLKTYLKENYPWAEIEIKNIVTNGDVPDEKPARIIAEKAPPGKTIFNLEFKNGKKITASSEVKAFDPVVKVRRALRKGYVIQEEDVYMTMMDIVQMPKGAVRDSANVVGKPLNRSLISNMIITDSMINDTPLVKKGHKVVLLLESPNFSITTSGETGESAFVGSHVKVINLASKKFVRGLLVDENTVRVEF
ncbi:MAG: flagellar basal body P-ring formation protein FlgA [Nitrospirae bacterium]|nr:flagellar basal body P-ring formation protein FlgA [Nitrospirota bacterium]